MERDLAVHRANRFAGEGEEDRAGDFFRWAWPKGDRGQAARRRHAHPLGSAHAGEGAGDGAIGCSLARCSLSVALASLLCEDRRERAAKKREKGKSRMTLGFWGPRPKSVFIRPT